MTFSTSALLILVSVIIFGVGFALTLLGSPDGKLLWELNFLGLAFFAAGHVLP